MKKMSSAQLLELFYKSGSEYRHQLALGRGREPVLPVAASDILSTSTPADFITKLQENRQRGAAH